MNAATVVYKVKTVKYFCKKAPSQMFDWMLNTSLIFFIKWTIYIAVSK